MAEWFSIDVSAFQSTVSTILSSFRDFLDVLRGNHNLGLTYDRISSAMMTMYEYSTSVKKIFLDYPIILAVLFAYFIVLLSIATVREFAANFQKPSSCDGQRTAINQQTRTARDISVMTTSIGGTVLFAKEAPHSDTTSSHAVTRLPMEKLDDVLGIFDLAKKSHIQGNTARVLRKLEQFCFPIDWRCPSASMTLLHCAILGGDVRLVQHLVDAGSDVHARNTYGDTCFYLAVYTVTMKGFTSATISKFDFSSTVDENDVQNEFPVANNAIEKSRRNKNALNKHDLYVLDLLLTHGADINAGNRYGHAPLHYAASMGRLPVVDFLLYRGSRSDAKDGGGFMPLQIALNCGHLEVASLLQRHLGHKLREEAKQLQVERRKCHLKFIDRKQIGVKEKESMKNVKFESSQVVSSRSSSTRDTTSGSSYSVPRHSSFTRHESLIHNITVPTRLSTIYRRL